ncbi:MAG: hypothetical protein PHE25_01870 [Candidatus Gracilibacteria bacterium]|nr:hypothetical protein [Candidatus Gracilibacteria bacterium]
MILFAIALSQELKILKEEFKNLKIRNIDFLLTGVGVLNTIYSIKDYISKNKKPDFIINIGVCGKINDCFLDFFQVYRIKNLANNKEIICPIYINFGNLKSIASSDKIITSFNELENESFVDMESAGIDFICDKEKIPYIIIKKPFDIVSKNSKKVDLKSLEDSLRGFNYLGLIREIENFISKNTKNNFDEGISNLKQKLKLTFSENELLKKYINKNIAFGSPEENIFKNLDLLNKKEILDLIKK